MPEDLDATALTEQWLPLALGLSQKWGALYAPWLTHDLESAAAETLWALARRVAAGDIPMSDRFPGLVRKGVNWSCYRVLDIERKKNRAAFHRAPLETDSRGEVLDPLDLLVDDAPEVGTALADRDAVDAILAGADLSDRESAVLRRRVVDGLTLGAVAAEIDVCTSRAGQLYQRARRRLADAAGRKGLTAG